MYLDTHTKTTMEESVCKWLKVSNTDLINVFDKAYHVEQDSYSTVLKQFITEHLQIEKLDKILFYHLSRRLKNEKIDESCKNLYDLLLQKTVFSDFLKEHGVEFKMDLNQKHLLLFHNGEIENFDKKFYENGNVNYIKWRLGYYDGQEDYCVNGFALKDLLYKNDYARSLYYGPEFLNQLAEILQRDDILEDYFQNSEYYCLEYLVPIEKVIFDGRHLLTNEEKSICLMEAVLERLYDYFAVGKLYMYDHENPVLRLDDKDFMPEKFLIQKELITYDML